MPWPKRAPTGSAALEADQRLARMLDRRGESYTGSWLEEHLEHGFPERHEIVEALHRHGKVRVVPNENLWTHKLFMRSEMTRRTRPLADFVARTLEPVSVAAAVCGARRSSRLSAGADRGVVYRTIVVADCR